MLWRLKFLARTPLQPCKTQFFALFQSLPSCIELPGDKKQPDNSLLRKFIHGRQLPGIPPPAHPVILTPRIVQTTLRNCASDLIALSFFLWCARQPNYFHDRATVQCMVNVVSNLSQRYQSVRGIMEGLATVGCVTKAQTLLLLLRIFWYGAMYDLVFEVFEEMGHYGYTSNTYARNILMDVLFKIGSVDRALRVLKENPVPNFLTFSTAVCNLCRINDFNNLKCVLRCMLGKGYYLNAETYALVLNCFCKFSRMDEALQLLGLMVILGAPISVDVWSIIIDGFVKSGRIIEAADILEKMIDSGCSPNIVTFTSLVKGLLESQMSSKAFEILSIMESEGYYPDLVLCNVLIDCLSKVGRFNDAFEIFSSLRERRLIPDVYTFSSLMSTVCLSRQFFLWPLLTSGFAVQPDLVVCNCLLSYCCKAGYPSVAIEFYYDMMDRGFVPDKYSFAALLSALCRSGRIQEAVNVYCGLIENHPGLDAHIHTTVIVGLIKSDNFHRAVKLFRNAAAQNLSLDVVSYNVAIKGLLKGGQAREAYMLFREMEQIGITPNECTYNLLLSGFCKDRDLGMVKHLLQEIIDSSIKVDRNSYKLMESLLYNSNHSPSVRNLFNELRRSGLLPNETHNSLTDDFIPASRVNSIGPGNTRNTIDVGMSSSDDLSDVACSVG